MTVPISYDRESKTAARTRRQVRSLINRPPNSNVAVYEIKVRGDTQLVTTGDGKFIFVIPTDLNGTSLIDVEAYVTTVSTSGTPTIQIRNITAAVDILSTRVTIDANEYWSENATTPAVINVLNAQVSAGDRIAIDVDVSGTGAKGLGVILSFG